MENLQRSNEVGDRSGVETIWTCCVTCLPHLTALSHFISQREPALKRSMNNLCDLTLDKLGDLCREVHVDVYSYFDVLTEVRIVIGFLQTSNALTKSDNQISWKRALDTIDARIGSHSHAESESLRYLRGVIEKVHADLQANLQRCGPSPLISSVLLVDGRTEDSKFPSLLSFAARERYGL